MKRNMPHEEEGGDSHSSETEEHTQEVFHFRKAQELSGNVQNCTVETTSPAKVPRMGTFPFEANFSMRLNKEAWENATVHDLQEFKEVVNNNLEILLKMQRNTETHLLDLGLRVKGLEDILTPNREKKSSVLKLILRGTAIPQEKYGENLKEVLAKMALDKWGIGINQEEIEEIHRFGYMKGNIAATFTSFARKSTFDRLLFRYPNWNGQTVEQRAMKLNVCLEMTDFDRFVQQLLLLLKKEKETLKVQIAIGGWNLYKESEQENWHPVRQLKNISHLLQNDIVNEGIKQFQDLKNYTVMEQLKQLTQIKLWFNDYNEIEEIRQREFNEEQIQVLNHPINQPHSNSLQDLSLYKLTMIFQS